MSIAIEQDSQAYEICLVNVASVGIISREILEQMQIAKRQWEDRPSIIASRTGDVASIRHVPFARVGKVNVRLKYIGKLKPRRVSPSDEVF